MDLDRALRILNEHFDAFVLLGSMYTPEDGITEDTTISRGNQHIIDDLVRTAYDTMEYGEVYEEEEEEDG